MIIIRVTEYFGPSSRCLATDTEALFQVVFFNTFLKQRDFIGELRLKNEEFFYQKYKTSWCTTSSFPQILGNFWFAIVLSNRHFT